MANEGYRASAGSDGAASVELRLAVSLEMSAGSVFDGDTAQGCGLMSCARQADPDLPRSPAPVRHQNVLCACLSSSPRTALTLAPLLAVGRVRHFASITSPLTLLASPTDLQNAQRLLKEYQEGTGEGRKAWGHEDQYGVWKAKQREWAEWELSRSERSR